MKLWATFEEAVKLVQTNEEAAWLPMEAVSRHLSRDQLPVLSCPVLFLLATRGFFSEPEDEREQMILKTCSQRYHERSVSLEGSDFPTPFISYLSLAEPMRTGRPILLEMNRVEKDGRLLWTDPTSSWSGQHCQMLRRSSSITRSKFFMLLPIQSLSMTIVLCRPLRR